MWASSWRGLGTSRRKPDGLREAGERPREAPYRQYHEGVKSLKIIRDTRRSFDLDRFLQKPLFAHLSTQSSEGPRHSPIWFLWEEEQLWFIGTTADTFPNRILHQPACAIGIVDYDPRSGGVFHAGFRGRAEVLPYEHNRVRRLLSRYLGPNEPLWDPRFQNLGDGCVLIRFTPETAVVRDQSYAVGEGDRELPMPEE